MRPARALAAAVRVSRPHLWTYTLGAAFLGAAVAAGSVSDLAGRPTLLWLAAWLTVPAGWLFHGLNDAFDAEADAANARKDGVERPALFPRPALLALSLAGAALYAPLVAALPVAATLALSAAVAGALAYNVPPLRLKARPWLDGLAYLVPVGSMVAGYAAVSSSWPPPVALLLAFAFSFAMHAYSAAVDVDADRAAGIETVAAQLGGPRAVSLAAALCLALAVPVAVLGGAAWGAAPLAYAVFFAAHRSRMGVSGFAPRRWYGAFLALHFFIGSALTAGLWVAG